MAIVNATDANFIEETSTGVTLVDFWAPWCGPCKMIAPVLEELDQELNGKAKIVKVNVDENQAKAAELGVMSIPAIIVFKDGEIVEKAVGFKPKEAIVEMINNHM